VPSGLWRLKPDLEASPWTPRRVAAQFCLLSSSGVPIEDSAHLVGHASTSVTEKVYRQELRPVLSRGATAMDALFGRRQSWSVRLAV